MSLSWRNWKDFAARLCEIGLLATVVFSVATAFDHLHRYLELFSHFRLQYFVASLILAVVFIALRWTSYALLGTAMLALNAYFVVPWYLPAGVASDSNFETAANGSAAVTLMLANIRASNTDTTRFVALVKSAAPDVIVMQEATPHWLASLDGIKSSYPYRLAEPRNDPFGIALYSKFPLDATAIIESPPRGFPEIVATAIIGDARLNLISTHPMPPIGESNYGARNLQLDGISQLASRTPVPVVVIGDLNITMWASHYRRFLEVSGLKDARRGFGVVPTWPLFFPPAMIPIDHCLVSEDVRVSAFETGPRIGSDHLPIIVSLLVPPKG